jgi:hypothetical protein
VISLKKKLTLISNTFFDYLNDTLEGHPRSIRSDIRVPTSGFGRSQGIHFSDALYRLSTHAPIAL